MLLQLYVETFRGPVGRAPSLQLAVWLLRDGLDKPARLTVLERRSDFSLAAREGAALQVVPGHIGDAGKEARRYAAECGYFDVSTLREPYRIEGKKTLFQRVLTRPGTLLAHGTYCRCRYNTDGHTRCLFVPPLGF